MSLFFEAISAALQSFWLSFVGIWQSVSEFKDVIAPALGVLGVIAVFKFAK